MNNFFCNECGEGIQVSCIDCDITYVDAICPNCDSEMAFIKANKGGDI